MHQLTRLFAGVVMVGAAAGAAQGSAYVDQVLNTRSDNLVLYYRLNEPAGGEYRDPVQNIAPTGSAYNGQLGITNYPLTTPRDIGVAANFYPGLGPGNTAFNFTGKNGDGDTVDTVDMGSAPRLNSSALTVAFFMNTTHTPADFSQRGGGIFNVTPGNSNAFQIRLTNEGKLAVVTQYNTAGGSLISNNAYTDGQWHHVVVVRNGNSPTNARIYVDGSLAGATHDFEMEWGASYSNRVGTWGSGSVYYQGLLDELSVWDMALTEQEVLALYQSALIPEPASIALMGGAGLLMLRRLRDA